MQASAEKLPLTLALSPQAGRGDVAYETLVVRQNRAAYTFSPLAGRRCPAGRMRGSPLGRRH